jgi:thioredoxin-dependent peroxiredoxin
MLQAGQQAPLFSLPNADMEDVALAAYQGRRNVVLYFYLRDGSPLCTQQSIEFSDAMDDFDRLDTTILGVSTDDCLRHADFRDQHGIGVDLLSDTDCDVCRQYEVLQPRDVNGTIRHGVQRSTFVIDRKGMIRHALYGISPRGHAREVLGLVASL